MAGQIREKRPAQALKVRWAPLDRVFWSPECERGPGEGNLSPGGHAACAHWLTALRRGLMPEEDQSKVPGWGPEQGTLLVGSRKELGRDLGTCFQSQLILYCLAVFQPLQFHSGWKSSLIFKLKCGTGDPGCGRYTVVGSFSCGAILGVLWKHLITENSLPLACLLWWVSMFCPSVSCGPPCRWVRGLLRAFCLGSISFKITQLLGLGSYLTHKKSTHILALPFSTSAIYSSNNTLVLHHNI